MSSIDSAIIKALVDHIGMDPNIVPEDTDSNAETALEDITPESKYLKRINTAVKFDITKESNGKTYYGFSSSYLEIGDILLFQRTNDSYQAGVVYYISTDAEKKYFISSVRDGIVTSFIFYYEEANGGYFSSTLDSYNYKQPDNITTGVYVCNDNVYLAPFFLKIMFMKYLKESFSKLDSRIAKLEYEFENM